MHKFTFDGHGINDANGEYKPRVATLTSPYKTAEIGNMLAAAPDLLTALVEMMREFEPDQADYDDGYNYNPPNWLVLAREAIATAT